MPDMPEFTPPQCDDFVNEDFLPAQGTDRPDSTHNYNYWRVPGESPKLYKALGVLVFKELCPTTNRWVRKYTGLGKMPRGATKEERIDNLIFNTKTNEAIHLGLTAVYGALEYKGVLPNSALGIAAYQVPANLYPIMLQRYNRLVAWQKMDELRTEEA